jgi:hypothetical protein
MAGSDEDHGRSRRPGTEDQRWSSIGRIPSDRMIERSGDAVCGLCRARGDEEYGFLGLALKARSMICQWFGFLGLGLKTGSYGLVIRASKSLRQFLGLDLKTMSATVYRLCHRTDGRMKTA